MLCKTTKVPITEGNWIAEQKYDGIRAQLTVQSWRWFIETRTGQDITHRFPEIRPTYLHETYILDGEICHLVGDTTDFQAIQARVQRDANVQEYAMKYPAVFIAFDCLMFDSISTMHHPLWLRRQDIIFFVTPQIIKSQSYIPGNIHQEDHPNWEGFIYKDIDSPYLEGKRSPKWLKYKFVKREYVWVVGYTHGMGRRTEYFGALVVARLVDGVFKYAGTVGTGYTDFDLEIITNEFRYCTDEKDRDLLSRSTYHVAVVPFQIEVEYLELTKAGIMRQPSFKV